MRDSGYAARGRVGRGLLAESLRVIAIRAMLIGFESRAVLVLVLIYFAMGVFPSAREETPLYRFEGVTYMPI